MLGGNLLVTRFLDMSKFIMRSTLGQLVSYQAKIMCRKLPLVLFGKLPMCDSELRWGEGMKSREARQSRRKSTA
jgi:hypothetical protein